MKHMDFGAFRWLSNALSPNYSKPGAQQDANQESAIDNVDPIDVSSTWTEIPLSDDDEQPSPRGVLEFRKVSESEAEEKMPYPTGISCAGTDLDEPELRRRQRSSTSDRSSPLPSTSASPRFSFSPQPRQWVSLEESEDATANLASTCDKKDSDVNAGPPTLTLESAAMALHKGDFQIEDSDDFASTKTALQHQLADALSALDLTRKQADALRDRLRTYTSSMKQQTNDLRASTRSLSQALDKTNEYKTRWKKEAALKDEAKSKVEEMDKNVRSLQLIVNQRETDIKLFCRGVDNLNALLGVDSVDSNNATDKLAFTSEAVTHLLNLIEKLQTEAAMSSLVSIVELKDSLRKFEEEKVAWISFAKEKEDSLSGRISQLESENDMLKDKLRTVHESAEEIQIRWNEAKTECSGKDNEILLSSKIVSDLQAMLRSNEEKLAESVASLKQEIREKGELQASFTRQQVELENEKRQIDRNFKKLKEMWLSKKDNARDQSTSCQILDSNDQIKPIQCHVEAQTSESFFQSENDGSLEMQLQREIADLKLSLDDMMMAFYEREDDCMRMRGDLRQLSWTCRYQEVTMQTLCAENRSLRVSISKLKQEKEASEDESATKELQERSPSKTTSECGTPRLQTVLESSVEEQPTETVSKSPLMSNDGAETQDITSELYPVPVSVESSVKLDFTDSASTLPSHNRSQSESSMLSVLSLLSTDKFTTSESQPSRRKRVKRSHKHKLPIWRQENPSNQFSEEKGLGYTSSSDSSDVFSVTEKSRSRSSKSRSSKGSNITPLSPIDKKENKRRIGIPMSEDQFAKMVAQMNPSVPSPRLSRIGVSLYDDGYSSSAADALDPRHMHSTLLGYEVGTSSDEDGDVTTPIISEEKPVEPCLVFYMGRTFDATRFGLVEMRQFMCEIGIAHSAPQMDEFIDFLAAKTRELDNDPKWRGHHSLGTSEDWLSLKGLF